MKKFRGWSLISHLLAVGVGLLIWQGVVGGRGKVPVDSSKRQDQRVTRDSAEAEVLLRLGASREEERQRLSAIEKEAREPTADPEPLVSKPMSQYLLEERIESQAEVAKDLEALIKRSAEFQKVADLRVPLMEALTEADGSKKAVAIFIAWYGRDPVTAMNELAARPSWSRSVLSEQAMVAHLTTDVLLEQLVARNRSSDFREAITESLAEHWVAADDLRGFSAAYDQLGGVKAEALMEKFLDERWVPRDGVADMAFVSTGMSASCRKAFLTKLLDASPYDPSREWTDGMAKSLFRESLGEEQVAAIQKAKAEREAIASRLGTGGCCGGGEEEDGGQSDRERVSELMTGITAENEGEALDRALGRLLEHDRDYLELFGAGTLSADEVFQEMVSQIPGGEDHEMGLRRALYQKLAGWNPEAAVGWASGHLSEAELEAVTMDYGSIASESRASRMLELMEFLPIKFEDGRYVGQAPWMFSHRLKNWRILDAEAAAAAMSRSPGTMDLAKKLAKEPVDESENSRGVMPPLEEEGQR